MENHFLPAICQQQSAWLVLDRVLAALEFWFHTLHSGSLIGRDSKTPRARLDLNVISGPLLFLWLCILLLCFLDPAHLDSNTSNSWRCFISEGYIRGMRLAPAGPSCTCAHARAHIHMHTHTHAFSSLPPTLLPSLLLFLLCFDKPALGIGWEKQLSGWQGNQSSYSSPLCRGLHCGNRGQTADRRTGTGRLCECTWV